MAKRYLVTEEQLPKVIKTAYALSSPQGMGFMHFRPGELPKETLDLLMSGKKHGISMDYVHGRAVKFHISIDKDGTMYFYGDRWYDHSDHQLKMLIQETGVQELAAV